MREPEPINGDIHQLPLREHQRIDMFCRMAVALVGSLGPRHGETEKALKSLQRLYDQHARVSVRFWFIERELPLIGEKFHELAVSTPTEFDSFPLSWEPLIAAGYVERLNADSSVTVLKDRCLGPGTVLPRSLAPQLL